MSEEVVCLNCKKGTEMKLKDISFSESTDEVPEWSKRHGNYSPLPKMITCDERYNLNHRDKLKPEIPKLHSCPIKLTLEDLPKEVWVFVWAAVSSEDPLHIQKPVEAYQNEINHFARV